MHNEKPVLPIRMKKSRVVAKGVVWEGSWEQACDREYRIKNKERNNQRQKDWCSKNKDKKKVLNQNYKKNNKEKIAEATAMRKASNHKFRFICRMRSLILDTFKRSLIWNSKKDARTHNIIGCTTPEFLTYIVAQFTGGMTLENYGRGQGKWCLDHVIPIAAADDFATSEEHHCQLVVKLNHHTNLRPLWWEENEVKSGRYDKEGAKRYLGI
jgi:hypothetical protein